MTTNRETGDRSVDAQVPECADVTIRRGQRGQPLRRLGAGLAAVALVASLSACGGMTPRQRDTAVGAGLGGAAGAALGGGVLGTAGGAAAGGIIGNQVGK